MFPIANFEQVMPGGFLRNIFNSKFCSISLKAKIIAVGIKDTLDKRTERPVPKTFQEYSKFN